MAIDLNNSVLNRVLPNFEIKIVDEKSWSDYVSDNTPLFSYLSVEYLKEYYQCESFSLFSITIESRIRAIFYLLFKNDDLFIPPSGLNAPLMLVNEDYSMNVAALKKFKGFIRELGYKNIPIQSYEFRVNMSAEYFLKVFRKDTGVVTVKASWSCVLTAGMDFVRKGYRKSYKSLINKGLRLFKINIIDANSGLSRVNEAINTIRALHFKESGRQTRSIKTWEIQGEMILRNQAFLVELLYENEVIGSALFQHSRVLSVYSVAAYRRDMFNLPIGHVIQHAAIEHLCNLKIDHHILGDISFSEDKKEFNISSFKEGFSNNIVSNYHGILD